MSFAEFLVGVIEVIVGFMGLVMFCAEHERWPGQYHRWTPFTVGRNNGGTVEVGVRRKSEKVMLRHVYLSEENFDEQLHEAQSVARQRCIELNAGQRHITRRLPR